MIRFIYVTFKRLLAEVTSTHTRYLYHSFSTHNRLTGLVGPRGVGKTTMLLQYIKHKLKPSEKAFYFSADLIYFQQASLLEFVAHLHEVEGYNIIFIDEIHKYRDWSIELKNLYDSFPSLKIVFSGSSMLDLVHGRGDLSRRAKMYYLRGMSFREYINFVTNQNYPPFTLEELLTPQNTLSSIPQVLPMFKQYLEHGYYPFVFDDVHSYYEKLTQIIDKTIYEDIANFYQLKAQNLYHFKRLLTFLGSIPPGEANVHNIGNSLGIDDKTAEHYLWILNSVGLVRFLYPYGGGGKALSKPLKICLNNTTLIHTLKQYHGNDIHIGTQRELFFVQAMQDAGHDLYFSNEGDFRTNGAVFEIGGKSKSRKQLKGVPIPSFVVKDDILTPMRGEIPLYYFGFLL
ncbi:MAG: ATP-binding protein [Verrucomicrobia bacterium]|nr:ATP-binding protein [Verrucomicrobiota bacterium]